MSDDESVSDPLATPTFTTKSEWVDAFATCLSDAGWVIHVDKENSQFDLAQELSDPTLIEAYNAAFDRCRAAVGEPPAPTTPLDLPQLYRETVAHGELVGLSDDEWEQVNESCPQPGAD